MIEIHRVIKFGRCYTVFIEIYYYRIVGFRKIVFWVTVIVYYFTKTRLFNLGFNI